MLFSWQVLLGTKLEAFLIKRWLSRGLKVGITGGVLLLVLLAVLWVEHSAPLELSVPTGPFAVGRLTTAWVDEERIDLFAPSAEQKRELVVWIWYPAAAGQSAPIMDDYLPAPLRAEVERSRGALISKFLTRDLSKVHGHSTRNSGVAPQHRSYPVVIMRAGASAEIWNYSTLAEDLASHGYVVVGFDAPYRTSVVVFPDGRVMRRIPENNVELCSGQEQARCVNKLLDGWTADIAFVLDRLERLNTWDASGKFAGRLDMTRVGVFGHSFGGAAAAQFCHDDFRCKAGIDVDGAPFGSVIREGIGPAIPVPFERPRPRVRPGKPSDLGQYPIDLRSFASGWKATHRDPRREPFPLQRRRSPVEEPYRAANTPYVRYCRYRRTPPTCRYGVLRA